MMREVRRFEELGGGDYGWLQARYHFSFARYFDPKRVGFGALLVVNDDRVAAGSGFDPHGHKDMEIITYVREGEIRHVDNLGHEGVTKAGDVQVMSAGTGIVHAEYASETERTVLYQIWIESRKSGIVPRWEAMAFPRQEVDGALPVMASGDHGREGALYIEADAAVYGGRMPEGAVIVQDFGCKAYILISQGEVESGGEVLHTGDALACDGEGAVELRALTVAEIVVVGLPR